MDATTQRLLELANPWILAPETVTEQTRNRLPDPFIDREIGAGLGRALSDSRKAHLVIGPRQAGKSTLVWSVLRALARPVLFVNCEEAAIRTWCRSPTLFAAEVVDWVPEGGVIFFEEAQWLDEAGLFIKGLIDAHLERTVVVTGSASFHLLARTRESLAGRATRHRVWPFSLGEISRSPAGVPLAGRGVIARRALARQLVVGGYPEAWLSENPQGELDALVGAFVLRDASDRFRIERPESFSTLLRLVAGHVGDLVNRAEWGQVLGIASSTVDDYLSILEETHILRRVRPFIGGRRAELTKTPKPYFVDNGLRNALAGNMRSLDHRADIGKLLESWVFSELHKTFPEPGGVRYWRTRSGAEVDFVVEPRPGDIVAFEVKAARGKLRVPRAARSFIEAYEPTRLVMVYRGEARRETIGATEIDWLPAEALPDLVASLQADGHGS